MSQILVLHPGEMGSSLAACLKQNGHDVSWVSSGRSNASKERASSDKLKNLGTLESALEQVDVVISICPPEFAETVAASVDSCDFQGLYVDANATSPMTAARISELFADRFVDGSVIGPPARSTGRTRLYLSGQRAQDVFTLFEGTHANPNVLGTDSTAASALKMCYAGYTKGTSALLVNLRALAEAHGVSAALLNEWSISQPELEVRSERVGPSVSRKAWRFAGEMREIASTFEDQGLPSGFHQGAADVYDRLADFKEQPPASTAKLIDLLLRSQ